MSVELIPQWWRRVFAWFANRQLRKFKTEFHCPACQATLPSRVGADLLWEEAVPCPACGDRAPLTSRFMRTEETEEMKFADTEEFVERPDSTRIVEENTGSGRRWEVPAKGGWNFMLTFALVWLVFTTVVFGGTFLKANNWLSTLAPLVFPVLGLGFLYIGLRMSLARHTLEVDPVHLVYTRRFLGMTKRRTVRRESIESVQLACIYAQDGEPVYGLEVKSPAGRIRFGSTLAPQEKAWLCQQVREALGFALGSEAPPSSKSLSNWRGGSLEMERGPDHGLVRSHSRSAGTFVLAGGLFFVSVGLYLLLGAKLEWAPWDLDFFFYFLFNGLLVLKWFGMVAAILVGFWLLTFGWISRRTIKMLQADERSLSMIATSGGRMVQHTWNVEDVGRMSVVIFMRMNGTQVYQAVVTLPDRVVTFGLGAPRAELQRAVSLLSAAMGQEHAALPNDHRAG
ncbi:hypothetical protein [Roseimicrobium gellanilyticum]|nr:hypothetical protein [Roseimicrobium gellanilyticum]